MQGEMVAAGLAVLLGANACLGATVRVPEDSPTVLAAVDLAMPGDSVLVGPGMWSDSATRVIVADNGPFTYQACAFARGGVVIRGQGSGVTALNVGGSTGAFVSDIVFVQRVGEGALRVEGLTLTGAGGVGGGAAVVGLYSDGLELRACRLEGNVNSTGSAVQAASCSVTVADCEVIGNTSSAGVVAVFDAPLRVSGSRFEGNAGRCIQTDTEGFAPLIQDSEFVRNRGSGSGVGLNLIRAAGFVVERCLFLENVAETGSGAAIRASGGSGEIRFNVFAYDSCYASTSGGAGIRAESSTMTVLNNTFVGCYSVASGSAFAGVFGGSAVFRNNVVTHSPRGAAVHATSTVITGNSCNLYWANAANFGMWTPSSTDIVADPLFCDLVALDVTVRDDSPCLNPPTPSCASIGALGAGCGGVSVEPTSFGRIKAMYR